MTRLRFSVLSTFVLLGILMPALAFAGPLVDPATDPAAFLAQLMGAIKTCWPLAIALGAYGLLELATLAGKEVPFLAWLGKGRTTMVIAGGIGVLGAGLNSYLNGANPTAAVIAAVAAIAAYWHPQAPAVVAQKGFTRFSVMLAIATLGIGLVALNAGCGGSQRNATIQTALTATNSASAALTSFDAQHQQDLVAQAATKAQGEQALADYRVKRDVVTKYLIATYQAIAAAATLNNDPSIAAMVAAAAQLQQALKALGISVP